MEPVIAAITVTDWLSAIAIMLGSFTAVLVIRRSVRTLAERFGLQPTITKVASSVIGSLVVLIGLAYAFRQLGLEVGPVLGALGIGGFVVAIALQPVLGNMVASAVLHARRPIRLGDQIYSNDLSGTVIDINGRAVVLMTFDGERLFIPNLRVLDAALLNQTIEPYRRSQIPFQVDYDADLRHAQRTVEHALRSIDALADSPNADVMAIGFADSGIDLVARIWHPSEELTARWAISEATITIRETLAREGITIPFPQRVVHFEPSDQRIDSDDTDDDS